MTRMKINVEERYWDITILRESSELTLVSPLSNDVETYQSWYSKCTAELNTLQTAMMAYKQGDNSKVLQTYSP